MAPHKYKVEVFLNGEFTTIDVYLEGHEIGLREINDNEFYKLFNEFIIDEPLNIHVILKGWSGSKWSFLIKINDKDFFKNKGTFSSSGYVTFTEPK